MRARKNKYAADVEKSYQVISGMRNPLNPSEEEIQAAKNLDALMDGMVSDLADIQPTPELASTHADYLASLRKLAGGAHDLAQALEDDAAFRTLAAITSIAVACDQGTPARTALEQALGFSLSSTD
jgi:hypothetical protein